MTSRTSLSALLFVSLALLAELAAPVRVHASPPDVLGYGARSSALGLTGVSWANDYEATFANPAGLATQRRTGVSIGMQAGALQLTLDDQAFPIDPTSGQVIGFHLPLPFGGPLKDVLVLGTGFYTPSNTVLRNDIIFTEIPQFAVLARAQSVALHLGLGINLDKVVPGLRVGVGFSVLANTAGRLDVELDEGSRFVSLTETQLLAGFNPIIGVQYDRDTSVGKFTFGLVWRDEVRSDVGLNIQVEGLPIPLPIITINAVAQYDPHAFVFEAGWSPTPNFMVALQLGYERWSRWPGVVGKSSEFSNLPPDPEFRDTITPRLGLEYRTSARRTKLALRLGYSYEMTPAPPARIADLRDSEGAPLVIRGVQQTRAVRYLDSDRHVFTGGGGVEFVFDNANFGLDLFIQLHRIAERTHDVPAEGGTENMVHSGYILAGGWAATVEW